MKAIYLICGVSGSGKTWVCEQVTDRFTYVPHDLFYDNHVEVTLGAALSGTNPVLTECPFGERVTRDQLLRRGAEVKPLFVLTDPQSVYRQYYEREKKPPKANVLTRALSIKKRAIEWQAPAGSAEEMLGYLRKESEKWKASWVNYA